MFQFLRRERAIADFCSLYVMNLFDTSTTRRMCVPMEKRSQTLTSKSSNWNIFLLFSSCIIWIYSQTPRYYNVSDATRPRTADQQYSYSYNSKSESVRDSSNPWSRPERQSYSTTTERKSATGPGGYNYSTDRTSSSGSRPGDYSYSSSTSGRLPHGTTYRHYSYRF